MSNEIGIISVTEKKMAATFPTGTKAVARVKFALDGKRLLDSNSFYFMEDTCS
jgi:hypothetical protein